MSVRFRAMLLVLMLMALCFGFLNLFVPHVIPYDFARLHIFLFNLCSGGTVILAFTQGVGRISKTVLAFLGLSLVYAVLAFLEQYIPVVIITLLLIALAERVRMARFSFFPWDFFQADAPVSGKFHHAALLCLSMGLLISAVVILNNEYFHVVSMPKLQLNTFFLGFSFPVSLITMSLMFSFMIDKDRLTLLLKNLGFWNVNLGVIVFFLFIIFERLMPQVAVTLILFFTVIMIFYLFMALGKQIQQKTFLLSGMGFLLYTAVTGIVYILYEMMPGYSSEKYHWLLRAHSFAALYGWNLCGLAIICRYHDFPLRLHSRHLIYLHWVTVILLAPLGTYFRPFAVLTVIFYAALLFMILFSKGHGVRMRP
jgi:hypothetical protein